MWLRNCWQVAAFSREVVGGQLFARRICDEPVVLYRSMTGAPVALEDRCAHRAAPLSMGALIGDTLRCGYHGLCYDTTGKCVTIPGQDYIPQRARVRAYPAVEKHRLVWIWMGDPERADASTVPDVHWLDDPAWVAAEGYHNVAADYRLLNDNLLDLSHETYVHMRTIGHEAVAESPAAVKVEDGAVRVVKEMPGCTPPPFYQFLGRLKPTDRIDRWQRTVYRPPGYIVIDVGVQPLDAPAGLEPRRGPRHQPDDAGSAPARRTTSGRSRATSGSTSPASPSSCARTSAARSTRTRTCSSRSNATSARSPSRSSASRSRRTSGPRRAGACSRPCSRPRRAAHRRIVVGFAVEPKQEERAMKKRIDSTRRRVLQGVAGTAALGALPRFAFAQATPVKIGLILPMTGPFASTGKQIAAACKLYMERNGDTVAGRKVELILKDDTGLAPETTKRIAQELVVQDKVTILAGFGLTPLAFAAAPVATEAKVPMVVMARGDAGDPAALAVHRAHRLHAAAEHRADRRPGRRRTRSSACSRW